MISFIIFRKYWSGKYSIFDFLCYKRLDFAISIYLIETYNGIVSVGLKIIRLNRTRKIFELEEMCEKRRMICGELSFSDFLILSDSNCF